MDFSYDESEQAIGDLALQVLTDGSDPAELRELERPSDGSAPGPRFDRALWATLADTGILGACLPEDLPGGGGAALGLVAMGRIWVPSYVMPEVMRNISAFSPLNWSLEGFYKLFLRGG